MNLILAALQAVLPPNRKSTPSGWTSFDAPCCHNRGHSRDDRKRGGIIINGDSFTFHCFNCGFKAGWTPGKLLSSNSRKLLGWLGVPDTEVQKLGLEALREKEEIPVLKKQFSFELTEVELPEMCLPLVEWASSDLPKDYQDTIADIIGYLVERGMSIEWYPWHWSAAAGYKDRVILPFYHDDKIVGWTGRKITDGKPKYLSHSQPSYVFNLSSQPKERKYVIVVEGQFDAVAVDGVAIMSNEPNEAQIARINALGREVIVVPDRDKAGAKLIKTAIDNNWSVSVPPWDNNIKDVADAVKSYGRLYVLTTILQYKESNQIKIQLQKKKLEYAN